jgi:hypothetical protein
MSQQTAAHLASTRQPPAHDDILYCNKGIIVIRLRVV